MTSDRNPVDHILLLLSSLKKQLNRKFLIWLKGESMGGFQFVYGIQANGCLQSGSDQTWSRLKEIALLRRMRKAITRWLQTLIQKCQSSCLILILVRQSRLKSCKWYSNVLSLNLKRKLCSVLYKIFEKVLKTFKKHKHQHMQMDSSGLKRWKSQGICRLFLKY